MDEDWKYIRREGDVGEELFHLSEDARSSATWRAIRPPRRFCAAAGRELDRLTGKPLLPEARQQEMTTSGGMSEHEGNSSN